MTSGHECWLEPPRLLSGFVSAVSHHTDFGSKAERQTKRRERAGGERAGTIDRMKKVGPNSTRYKKIRAGVLIRYNSRKSTYVHVAPRQVPPVWAGRVTKIEN